MSKYEWEEMYSINGLTEGWARKSKESIPERFEDSLPEELYIHNRISNESFNLNIQNSVISDIPDYNGIKRSKIYIFVLDMVNDFCKEAPKSDSGIYTLYEQLDEKIDENLVDFPIFYSFIREGQSTHIEKSPPYQRFEKALDKFSFDVYPLPGSEWEIPYGSGEITVSVDGPDTSFKDIKQFIDLPRSVTVTSIESEPDESISVGQEMSISPSNFNEGKRL